MRYFIIVVSGTSKKRSEYHLSIGEENEKYPSLMHIKSLVNDYLSDIGTAFIDLCVENIIELSKEDFESYKDE